MNNKVNDNNLIKCDICNKIYSSKSSLCNHNKKFHSNNTTNNVKFVNNCLIIDVKCKENVKSLTCELCNKIFNTRAAKSLHKKKCTVEYSNINKQIEDTNKKKIELEIIKENNIRLKEESKILQLKLKLDRSNEINHIQPINNQLINIIVDKNKTIEELTTKINYNVNNESIIDNKILGKPLIEFHKLTLNDVIIISRTEDNYINATQLCQAGSKQFNDWFRLNTTKQLISVLEAETGIPVSGPVSLIDIYKGGNNKYNQGSWVHPDLAIQLAQWISPIFALQVSKWIRTLLTDGQVELLKNKDDEIKLNKQKIQLLEDTYIKQQKRKSYPTNNVVYVLSTEDHKKNRLYIIGKACNLKNRLGNYNKTAEHEVVYYKNCESEKDMGAIETLVLKKLNKYREKANRDRFILPVENNISLFTNIIENCINFLDGFYEPLSSLSYQKKYTLDIDFIKNI